MDLRELPDRFAGRHENAVCAFERGRIVRRTFADVHRDVLKASERLRALGVEAGMRVGILAPSSYEYLVYDLALIACRAVTMAFTDDFSGQRPAALFEKYRLSLLLAGTADARRHAPGLPVAALDDDDIGVRALDGGPRLVDAEYEHPFLIFSSGSSGGTKGLVLNRRGVEATIEAFVGAVAPRRDDSLLLFLPMSNFQQRMMYYAALWYGFDVGVCEPARLFHALKELRPTMLVAPPALYEAIETRVSNLPVWTRRAATAAGELLRHVPSRALRERGARLVFRQVHQTFGGRMRFMVTGMAPIKRSTLELFERMQLPLYETYGLIECGTISLNVPRARRLGTVGRPVPGVELAFASDGEIIARRNPTMAAAYFECGEGESERTFIGGHRVATGDIGRLDRDGYLHLLGRKKEMIITSGGEKVHPEALEAEIDACPDVAKAVVFCEPAGSTLTAVVLPTRVDDAAARERIRRFVERLGDERPSFGIGTVLFTDAPFSRENGFLRPNLKLDRRRIARHFQSAPAARAPRAS